MCSQDRQCTSAVTTRHIRLTIIAVEKQNILHIVEYCEDVPVTLVILHAMRMRHIVICVLHASALFFHIIS